MGVSADWCVRCSPGRESVENGGPADSRRQWLGPLTTDGQPCGEHLSSQSWLTWVLPLVVLAGSLVLCCCFGLAAYLCRKKKRSALRARTAPKEEVDADEAATAEAAEDAGAVRVAVA